MKIFNTLILALLISIIANAQETIDLTVTGPGASCNSSQTLTKIVIGSHGGYGFSSVSFRLDYTGTAWELNAIGLGPFFQNITTTKPYPPCLSDGGWTYVFHNSICYDEITQLSGDGCGAAMPVELTHFEAQQEGASVLLNWQTATEINNDYFEIQRSNDGKDFETIDIVSGNGTTNNAIDYSYNDKSINNRLYYYRLKQVDFNGNFEIHDIISITLNNLPLAFNAFPTITHENLRLELPATRNNKILEVFSNMGQLVQSYSFSTETINKSISVAELSNGIYYLRLSDDTSASVIKILKQ